MTCPVTLSSNAAIAIGGLQRLRLDQLSSGLLAVGSALLFCTLTSVLAY
jgi:hypothetical protein